MGNQPDEHEEPLLLEEIRSGLQVGADRGGSLAGLDLGLRVSAVMPLFYKALDGNHPEFAARFNARTTKAPTYPPRTRINVRESDATIAFATNLQSPGMRLTLRAAAELGRPFMPFFVDAATGAIRNPDAGAQLLSFLRHQLNGPGGVVTLNVAGNAIPMLEKVTRDFLVATLAGPLQDRRLLAAAGLADPKYLVRHELVTPEAAAEWLKETR